MDTTFKSYWRTYLWRDATTRIITVNTIAFILIAGALLFIPAGYSGWWVGLFAVPASIFHLPARIWTVGTYMISQADFLHLLVNMLWLLLFGRLMEHAAGGAQLVATYVVGGLAGAAAFIVANTVSPGLNPYMLGASCSVIGVVGACMALMPKWQVNLLFLGYVKVIWVAVAAVVLFVLLEPNLYVSIAHGAGLVAGLAYGAAIKRKGEDFNPFSFAPRRPEPEEHSGLSPEAELDALLDKVHRSGYSSLSARERQQLFQLSQRLKR